MKAIKTIAIGILISVLFGISCQKEEEQDLELFESETQLLTFTDYSELYSRHTPEGSVLIEVWDAAATETEFEYASVTEKFDRSKISKKNSKSRISFFDGNGQELSILKDINSKGSHRGLQNNIADLFGKSLTYSFKDEQVGDAKGMYSNSGKTLNVPSIINMSMNTTKARPGSVITWNVDPSNDHGVAIYATYTPTEQNDLFLAEENLNVITRGIVLPDESGSYTVKASDLERFPDNSYIDIVVLRGTTTQPGNKSPIVTAISKSVTTVQVDR